jgi:PAS domain S-box-containing protein
MRYDNLPDDSIRETAFVREPAVTRAKPLLTSIPLVVQRYGLAVLSVAIALSGALFLDHLQFKSVEFPMFLLAITVTASFGGPGAAVLALVLSALAFNYYFTEPRYSFYVTLEDVPYYLVFILFALLVTWFSTLRRRVERNLRQSRDELQREVAIRTQQASLLNLTHDPIFVRDMNGVISYWNRGAEELYGWTAEQAVGKRTHDLMQTVFPAPFDEVQRNFSERAAGRENSEKQRLMERVCWWRADGRCSEMNTRSR